MTNTNTDDSTDTRTRVLGTIGDTEVRLVAEGPKAQWCADVVAAKIEGTFEAIRQQAEAVADD